MQKPLTSWQIHEIRRRKSLQAEPNAGHTVIAQLTSRNERVFNKGGSQVG